VNPPFQPSAPVALALVTSSNLVDGPISTDRFTSVLCCEVHGPTSSTVTVCFAGFTATMLPEYLAMFAATAGLVIRKTTSAGVRARYDMSFSSRRDGGASVLTVALKGIAWILSPYLRAANIVMVYLLGIIIVAMRLGRGASIMTAALSVAAFNFLFLPPVGTFVLRDAEFLLSFAVMLCLSLIVSDRTSRIRAQAAVRAAHASQLQKLASASLAIGSTLSTDEISRMLTEKARDIVGAHVAVTGLNENQRPPGGAYGWTTIGRSVARAVRPTPTVAGYGELLGWLAETPHQWYIDSCGKIRARAQETEVCAVTGVAHNRTGVTFSIGDWLRAAEMIGLSYREAALIVAAADAAGSSGTRRNRLRAQLLVAARIQSSSAPALGRARFDGPRTR